MNTFKIQFFALFCAIALQGCERIGAGISAEKNGDGKPNAPPATSPVNPDAGKRTAESAVDQLIPKIKVELPEEQVQRDGVRTTPRPNQFWWPNLLDVSPLRRHVKGENPLGDNFNYATEFRKLDFARVKADMRTLLKESKEWWPADYGNYGPFFIRMAWHSAGTYRALDGRGGADGGQQRFEPLNSWPDNANLDKARRLIQPLVDKYYPKLSWADAIVLAGNVALEDMGFKTLGFAGGRVDDWAPDLVYWGPEDAFLASNRFDENGNLLRPLAASVMGLIYVNPEGPDGKPDPALAAERIRSTFGRMGMNDEETVALIAGGHTLGKAHGAHKPEDCLGPDPAASGTPGQGTGWHNRCGKGHSADTVTSGIEGAWSPTPVKWSHEYFTNLYKYEWSLQKGPGGKFQWYAENLEPADNAPDAHDSSRRVPIMMLTTDLSLKVDPAYDVISRRFLANPVEFEGAFARAWFKLIHRDLGPRSRYLGRDFTSEQFVWQDPLPPVDHRLINASDAARLKQEVLGSVLSISDLIKTAWAAAVTYRGTDMKGGVNGARIRYEPQINWEVNEPTELAKNLVVLERIQNNFNQASGGRPRGREVSLADVIVLAGNAAVEEAARRAGFEINVPFTPGRTDANAQQNDSEFFANLKISADGFRNYYNLGENYLDPARAFIDRADMLTLTVPEMTVLTGGLRVLGANYGGSQHGVFTSRPETLTNDFFVNLMDLTLSWTSSPDQEGVFVGKVNSSGEQKWTATTHDLIFGSSSDLRMVSFTYSTEHAQRKFVNDFVKAWNKVMMLDRFDLNSH